MFPAPVFIDLLKSDIYFKFLKEPHIFRQEILAHIEYNPNHTLFVVDEVQKVPALLDEIHWLIENTDSQFILCGSSARKLGQKGVNLLGERAWKYHFFPLTFAEIKNFNLLKALNDGLIPSHFFRRRTKKISQGLC